jgi:YVTN family beta-propeller protein
MSNMNLTILKLRKLKSSMSNRIISLKGVVLIGLSLFAISCDDDDNKPSGQYADGVFVVNEGNFGGANGTVTHFSDANLPTQDLFGLVNNGRALGDVIQSMTIDDNVGYIVVNNSKKIEVVTASTFEYLYTIDGLEMPRYFTVNDGLGYVTEWVSFTGVGRVSVIDLNTHDVVDQINVGSGAESMLIDDDLLYVSNSFTNTVSVIDIEDREVIKTITVAASPSELLEDANGKIWVLCGGSYGGNDGAMVQIDPSKSNQPAAESVVKAIELGMNIGFPKATISPDKLDIFYFTGKKVYKFNVSTTVAPTDAFINEASATSFYGIGIDPKTDVLYVADDRGFTSSGTVFRYNLTGESIDNLTAGIGPNGFAFHD